MSDSPRLAELGDMTLAELMAMVRELVQRELVTYSKPKGYTEPSVQGQQKLELPTFDVGPWPEWLTLSRDTMYDDAEL
jgi:hypothetical protein